MTAISARPSWLLAKCPSWCSGRHAEDDRPEDREHASDEVEVPIIVGSDDGRQLEHEALRVQIRQTIIPNENVEPIITLGDPEFCDLLVISPESAARLARALTKVAAVF